MRSARIGPVLSKPLDALIVPSDQVVPGKDVVEKWDVPERARVALIRWGLPIDEEVRFVPQYQTAGEPELNLEGRAYYALGTMGNEQLGALEQEGSVWGIPFDAQIRGGFFNSSLEAFVDVSWRWHHVRKTLLEMAWDVAQYDEIDIFMDYILTLDPAARTRDDSLWIAAAEAW